MQHLFALLKRIKTSDVTVLVIADGGTLVLDEIGELPTETQTRLLRVLERGEVKPVGANRYCNVDVRIVAATHRDSAIACKGTRFAPTCTIA